MKVIKFVRIFLFILIIIGIGLLVTQKFWVSRLVDKILLSENKQNTTEKIVVNNNLLPVADSSPARGPEPQITIPYASGETPVRTGATELPPYQTTYQSANFTGYMQKEQSVTVPTDYYQYNGYTIRISFTPDGENKYGHISFKGSIQNLNKETGNYDNILDLETTDSPKLNRILSHNDDIIFVWSNFQRSGCCSTPTNNVFAVYNPTLNIIQKKQVSFEADTGLKNPSFSFFIQDKNLYVKSAEEYRYIPKNLNTLFPSINSMGGLGVSVYYLLQNGQIKNDSKNFKNDYLLDAGSANYYLTTYNKEQNIGWIVSLVERTLNLIAAGMPDMAWQGFRDEYAWRMLAPDPQQLNKELPTADEIEKSIKAGFSPAY